MKTFNELKKMGDVDAILRLLETKIGLRPDDDSWTVQIPKQLSTETVNLLRLLIADAGFRVIEFNPMKIRICRNTETIVCRFVFTAKIDQGGADSFMAGCKEVLKKHLEEVTDQYKWGE